MNIIVATSKNGIIGKNGTLPWYIPEDIKYFHDITKNNICVMGRKSFDSFEKYEPIFLQNRVIVVITSKLLKNKNNIYFTNINNVLKVLTEVQNNLNNKSKEIFILGGEKIYDYFIPISKYIYLTFIDKAYNGDRKFSSFKNYELIATSPMYFSKESNAKYQFQIYKYCNNGKIHVFSPNFSYFQEWIFTLLHFLHPLKIEKSI